MALSEKYINTKLNKNQTLTGEELGRAKVFTLINYLQGKYTAEKTNKKLSLINSFDNYLSYSDKKLFDFYTYLFNSINLYQTIINNFLINAELITAELIGIIKDLLIQKKYKIDDPNTFLQFKDLQDANGNTRKNIFYNYYNLYNAFKFIEAYKFYISLIEKYYKFDLSSEQPDTENIINNQNTLSILMQELLKYTDESDKKLLKATFSNKKISDFKLKPEKKIIEEILKNNIYSPQALELIKNPQYNISNLILDEI